MKWLKPYHLTLVERKGLTAMAVVIVILIFIRLGLIFLKEPVLADVQDFEAQVQAYHEARVQALKVSYAFNPNIVADSTIQTFAISAYAAKNWINQRTRGRKFYDVDDLLRIYGIDSFWVEINQDSIIFDIQRPTAAANEKKATLFKFDPNTASKSDFEKLGFPDWLSERIMNYRNKGGVFKTKADVKEIYGFPEALFEQIEPFIFISDKKPDAQPSAAPALVELNGADSIQLLSVKGIGPAFASRIIAYRNKLGGFVNINQLAEVYGIDAEKLSAITPGIFIDKTKITPLNCNKATFKELVAHPYLNYEQVKALVNYREKMGAIKRLDDLVNLPNFEENDIERLKPYLKLE